VRRGGWRRRPVLVEEGDGSPVGAVVRSGRRSGELVGPDGERLASLERRSRLYRVEYDAVDASGRAVGWIADYGNAAQRLGAAPSRSAAIAEEHVLWIDAAAERRVRLLLVAAAAALYLVLQAPYVDNGD
jgi:hypothetical protein